jgi:hypothetical protein
MATLELIRYALVWAKLRSCSNVPIVVRFAHVVMLAWVAPVTVAAVPEALPVTLPVSGPENPVAVSTPVEALYVSPPSVLHPSEPVAASNRPTLQVAEVLSATVTVLARVAVAALPVQEPDEPVQSPVTLPVSVAFIVAGNLTVYAADPSKDDAAA